VLTDDELASYCLRLGLGAATVELIRRIRTSPPSRRVSGGGRSVCARYPSRKMRKVIQAESAGCELAYIHECEYDDEVLEFYDQPEMIRLNCKTAGGRPNPRFHVPDFFVLATTWAGWVECKTDVELARRESKGDQRFVRDEDGGWISPPGRDYAAPYGLIYRVWTSSEVNWTLQRNLAFLKSYFEDVSYPLNSNATKEILELVTGEEGIALSDLVQRLGVATVDTANAVIARGDIYVDLGRAPLAEPESVSVFSSHEVAQAWETAATCAVPSLPSPVLHINPQPGDRFILNHTPHIVVCTQPDAVTFNNDQGMPVTMSRHAIEHLVLSGELVALDPNGDHVPDESALKLLSTAGPKQLKRALRKFQALHQSSDGETPTAPERSVRRWRSTFRQGEQLGGNGFLWLLDRFSARGNRRSKLPAETKAAMRRYVEEIYERPKQQTIRAAYTMMATDLKDNGKTSPSYETFRLEVKASEPVTQARKRRGARAAYQVESYNQKPPDQLPRHGDRPFELAHLDHTLGDIELIHSDTGDNIGRPWITMLTDAFSRRVLAVYSSYYPPSASSCMMVLTECVQRHNRLPESIVTDLGAEFGSTHYETMLAAYGITKKSRPPASPRHGSTQEKTFGTMNTQYVHNLQGTTQLSTSIRQLTKSVDPKRLAIWTLDDFHTWLCEWAYSVYDQQSQSELGMSPRETFRRGLLKCGERPQTLIAFDEKFYFLSLPSTQKGVAKIHRQKGVRILHIYYYCDHFARPENAGKLVPVRYDPFNRALAYAFVDGHWEQCFACGRYDFRNKSHREIVAAAKAIRDRSRAHRRRYSTVDAHLLGEFLTSSESHEALLSIRLKDSEVRKVNSRVLGTGVKGNSLKALLDGPRPGEGPSKGLPPQTPERGEQDPRTKDFNLDNLPPLGDYA
jgi:putative transposase